MKSLFGDARDAGPVLSGAQYQQGYKASVIGILGADAPRVSSRGSRFYNHDRWTGRRLIAVMCDWAKANPGCMPTLPDVLRWVSTVNTEPFSKLTREIVIANTPEILPLRIALALTGGAFHEALHSLISVRRDLTAEEAAQTILPRWALVKDWAPLADNLLHWANIVDDIHIERRGREQFEGIFVKLCDLQDYIIHMEQKGEEDLRAHGGKPEALPIIRRTYRDYGLGYSTATQKEALERYKADNLEAYELVTKGPLKPLLKENINLALTDNLGFVRLALDIVAKLAELGLNNQSDEQAKGKQPGDGKTACPNCGAPGNKLIVRPLSDGRGGKVHGKGVVTCTVCGWQDIIDVKKADPQQGSGTPDPESPLFIGFEEEDLDGGEGEGTAGSKSKPGKEKEGKGKAKKDEDGDENGKDGTESGSGAESEEGGEDESEGGNAGAKPEGPEEGDGGAEEGADEGEPEDTDDGLSSHGAGGHEYDPNPVEGRDWSHLVREALQDPDHGLMDAASALEAGLQEIREQSQTQLEAEEQIWNPYSTEFDECLVVGPSMAGREHDLMSADQILASVKEQVVYLRSRLRTIVKSLEQTRTIHGVSRGRRLSGRFLVDSRVAVLGRNLPSRAYVKRGLKIDLSSAVAVVIDESSSMHGELETATRIMMSIVEPFDGLGCATLAVGFRDGQRIVDRAQARTDRGTYHRCDGIVYDLFKGWNEQFRAVRWRFANTRAVGGTPMSDGVQFALSALLPRSEANRFMFVVTDGESNYEHRPVIRYLLRKAKEADIHVVGVGIGYGATGVKTTFPDHVWSEDMRSFPRLLLSKLNQLVDHRTGHLPCMEQPKENDTDEEENDY